MNLPAASELGREAIKQSPVLGVLLMLVAMFLWHIDSVHRRFEKHTEVVTQVLKETNIQLGRNSEVIKRMELSLDIKAPTSQSSFRRDFSNLISKMEE